MGVRREGRELALQALYSMDLNPTEMRAALQLLKENVRASAGARAFAEELVAGVVANREAIDKSIEEKSKNWAISRMGKVDLNILRLAVCELLFRDDIPKNVTMNEAIEVAKKFGTEESPAFVNGILDEIASALPEK
ncbi:MAG: N utilization substance protein [Geobacteraceae bacterium]|nr:MAG: N utilization substance protein [Geobacteraceae bacterium]